MEQSPVGWTLSELAEIVGGEPHGPADTFIKRPVPAGYNDPQGITFAENQKYLEAVMATDVAAVIIGTNDDCSKPHIRCESPRQAFGRILALLWRELPLAEGVHPTAVISQDCEIEPGAFVGAYCVVEAGAFISEHAKVFAFCYIGEGCRIAQGARIYPHVILYRDVVVGERSIIHSGTVLGADGFGYFWDGSRHRKVPQVGGVRIGDDCEIGALSAIDRATAGETLLGQGVKLDNLIQIAHNVEIGRDTVMASQTGIAGSTKIGERNIFGGQVGVVDHVQTANDVHLAGRAGALQSIPEAGDYLGMPATKVIEEHRIRVAISKLPELLARVRRLEQEISRLDKSE